MHTHMIHMDLLSGASPKKRGSRWSLQALGVCPAGLNCRFAAGVATNGNGCMVYQKVGRNGTTPRIGVS